MPSLTQNKKNRVQTDNTKQLYNGQLTTEETSDNRFVGKVRYIIEKQMAVLKQSLSLENIRNTQLGHIMWDYRIASALYNFQHRQIITDGIKAKKIAFKMKEKRKTIENKFSFIIRKQIHADGNDTKSINLSTVFDFPRLKQETLKQNVYFGSFSIDEAQNYQFEIDKGISLTEKYKNELVKKKLIHKNSKVIGIELASRHHRSIDSKTGDFNTKYRSYVEYEPNVNSYAAIKSKV